METPILPLAGIEASVEVGPGLTKVGVRSESDPYFAVNQVPNAFDEAAYLEIQIVTTDGVPLALREFSFMERNFFGDQHARFVVHFSGDGFTTSQPLRPETVAGSGTFAFDGRKRVYRLEGDAFTGLTAAAFRIYYFQAENPGAWIGVDDVVVRVRETTEVPLQVESDSFTFTPSPGEYLIAR